MACNRCPMVVITEKSSIYANAKIQKNSASYRWLVFLWNLMVRCLANGVIDGRFSIAFFLFLIITPDDA